MNELSKLDKELIRLLAKVKVNKTFIASVYQAMDTPEKKKEMIKFLEERNDLKMSDIYLKEMQINKKIIV